MLDMTLFIGAFAISLIAAIVIFLTKNYHIQRTAKGHAGHARQSAHRTPTPRIGGLAVLCGFVSMACLVDDGNSQIILFLIVSMLPVLIGGLGEDTGYDVSPLMRLMLSFASALVAGLLLSQWISRIGIPGIDLIVSTSLTAAIVTMLVSGGFSHALNLIDGLNGLSLGVASMMAAGLCAVAYMMGDPLVATLSMILMASCLGLYVLNFPFGKLFLGDAGAYSIGHILMWLAVLLINRHDEIAPFALLLILFWPIADMLLAIIRRYQTGKPITEPDRLHFHQIMMRVLEIRYFGRQKRAVTNPMASLLIMPMAALPILFGVIAYNSDKRAAVAFIIAVILFVFAYRGLGRLAKRK